MACKTLPLAHRMREAEDEAQQLLRELIPLRRCREYCEDAIVRSGGIAAVEAWFNDGQWLNQAQVDAETRRLALDALQVFRLADAERALATSRMTQARRLLGRMMKRAAL